MKFEAKVNYSHIDLQSGKEKKTTENYIIADAENWTDAETQIYEQMAKITNATITKAIKISDIVDIVKGTPKAAAARAALISPSGDCMPQEPTGDSATGTSTP